VVFVVACTQLEEPKRTLPERMAASRLAVRVTQIGELEQSDLTVKRQVLNDERFG